MKIAILHDELSPDARPDELDTLVQANAVTHALRELGHRAVRVGCTLNLKRTAETLRELRPDCVFNLVESIAGDGRLIHLLPALLDSLRLPYTGAGTDAMFLTSNKILCKQVLAAADLPTPPWFTLDSLTAHAGPIAGRYIIKSVWEEASIGIEDDSVQDVASIDRLRSELLARRDRLGGTAFAEAYVEGREFNLSLLGDGDGVCAFPPAEIQFVGYAADKPRIVGYSAKWREGSPEYRNTPRTFDFADGDRALVADLIRIAEHCWRLLGLRGYARVDFRVDAGGRPWILDVNANPCLSPDGGFVEAAARVGLSFTEIVRRLIEEVRRHALPTMTGHGPPGASPRM
ncbi:MAG: D-alanine--D-alanine ligase [Planctomycetes bacterium]|nr:D-alanine--D-alanine ligase [Planctomycetota bacterium]